MASFSSELGVKFPIQLEANHVIANSQVFLHYSEYFNNNETLFSGSIIKAASDKLLMNKFIRQNFGGGLTLKNFIS